MELVKSIRQSSRGTGKGIAWQIEIETPAVYGNIDAKMYGVIAASELVEAIRARWNVGQNVAGQAQRLTPRAENYRQMAAFIISRDPSFDEFHEFVRTKLSETRGTDFRRDFMPREENFAKYKKRVKKNYQALEPQGEIGKKRVRHQYIPATGPALHSSGLMSDNLRGKMRVARRMTMPAGGSVPVEAHIELRLPKSRQHTAAFLGGLSQSNVDARTAFSWRDMPQTSAALENAVAWQNLGKQATNFFILARIVRLAWRLMA